MFCLLFMGYYHLFPQGAVSLEYFHSFGLRVEIYIHVNIQIIFYKHI